MQYKITHHTNTANKLKTNNIQSSKIKAVRLTKAGNCQIISDNLQYFQISK